MFPKSSPETFATKLYQTLGTHPRFEKPKLSQTGFIIDHYAGKVREGVSKRLVHGRGELHWVWYVQGVMDRRWGEGV